MSMPDLTAALKKIAAKLRPDEVAVLAVLQYRIGKDGRQHRAA